MMKPFKFIRYFLVDNKQSDLSDEAKRFLLDFQKEHSAYSFIFTHNAFYALYLNSYEFNSNQRDLNLVHRDLVETTYLGQSFYRQKMKLMKNYKGVYTDFIKRFEQTGHHLLRQQYQAAQMDTDHYSFQIQYLIHSDQVLPVVACNDIIVDKVPMFDSGKNLLELPSELLGNILHSEEHFPDLYSHIHETYEDYDPQNDWSLINLIDFLKRELDKNPGWSEIKVVEQLNKIDTLKGICYRLGLPR